MATSPQSSLPLMAALEKSSWNVQEVVDSLGKPNFFSDLEAAVKNELDLTKRMRLLVAFSLVPKDVRQKYASEIMKIINIQNFLINSAYFKIIFLKFPKANIY